MHRIAAALLIVVAVLALNGGMLREAFAADAVTPQPPALEPAEFKSARVLSLLLILEALRQAPVALSSGKL